MLIMRALCATEQDVGRTRGGANMPRMIASAKVFVLHLRTLIPKIEQKDERNGHQRLYLDSSEPRSVCIELRMCSQLTFMVNKVAGT